ncbi:hypothetical protein J3B02_005392 [Coemansia erecta]|uniref:Ankyrin repeat protein n=1 Tax=Coemansia asiatica TaxID=1052880 RepID=A0A9W7XPS4_9FUNG|nr:hypothetical protein LPJ64_001351 [Coemansia asiatica]KAJ2843051.1 hypothetical protein J3B02_005392 [Coemansia erecta]
MSFPGKPALADLPFDILCRVFVWAQWPTLSLVSRVFHQVSRSMGVRARYFMVEFGRKHVLDSCVGLASRRPQAMRQDTVLLLLALGADPRVDNQWILRHACAHAWTLVVHRLLSMRAPLDQGLVAQDNGGTHNTQQMLDSWRGGARESAIGFHQNSPLLVDVHRDSEAALRTAAEAGHSDVIRMLVAAGADVAVLDNEPLVLAAAAGHTHAVRTLLGSGADASADQSRALRTAVLLGDANLHCVRLLLEHGAEASAMNDSCLLAAAYRGDGSAVPAATRSVQRRYASRPAPASFSHVQLVELLLEHGANANALSGKPLAFACSRNSPRTAAILISRGADVHANREEPLRQASERGFLAVVELLLQQGANAHAMGEMPLLNAARGGHLGVVRALLAAGADAASEGGRRALVAAARGGWPLVVSELVAHGADSSDPEFAACALNSREIREKLALQPPPPSWK